MLIINFIYFVKQVIMNDFIREQINEMEKYKWIESEKAGKDLGEFAINEWICKYAKRFRDEWNRKHNI